MTDTYSIEVCEVSGAEVVFEATAVAGAGWATGRSFVLGVLRDAGLELDVASSLDEGWLAQNLDRYVTEVRIERLANTFNDTLRRENALRFALPVPSLEPRVRLRARLASESLASLLTVGRVFGTRAFDVWLGDPRTPAQHAGLEIDVRWDQAPLLEPTSAALASHFPAGWKQHTPWCWQLTGADAALVVTLTEHSTPWRSMLDVRLSVEVPGIAALPHVSQKPKDRISPAVVFGTLTGSAYGPWFRGWARADDDSVPREEAEAIEPIEAFAARIASELACFDLSALTKAGLLGLFEEGLDALPPKNRPASFQKLASAPAATLSPRVQLQFDAASFWRRVSLLAALNERLAARAALTQARSKWKRVPSELSALSTSLEEQP